MSLPTRIIRYLGLEGPLILDTPVFRKMLPVFCPLSTADHPLKAVVRRLGLLGMMTMGWLSNIDAAIKFRGLFKACIRYEDLITSKENLVRALLQECGLGDKFKVVPAEKVCL
jgi:hypothetical protein